MTLSSLLSWIKGGSGKRHKRGVATATEAERPVTGYSSIDVTPDAGHTFTRSDFSVEFSGGRRMEHLRIVASDGSGRLEFQGRPVTPDQQITVSDLFAGDLVFVGTSEASGWFDFEVHDGESYSLSPGRVTISAATVPEAKAPSVTETASLSTEEPVADDGTTLDSLMACPELLEPSTDPAPQEAVAAVATAATPQRQRSRQMGLHRRGRRAANRNSKVGRSHRHSQPRKTQSRLSSTRRHKGPSSNQ